MRFFSLRPRKTEAVSVRRSLFSGHFYRTMLCLILLTLLQVCVPASVTLAASRPHQTHPLNIQALRTALKSKIRVTHTGHIQRARSTPLPRPIDTTEPAYNNTAISDDQKSTTANFDGQGESYSAQNLQNLGLAPGLNVTVGPITYSWPHVPSGAADNYQSTGQILSVPSISDAATIGFLGAATNGDSSGTATLTFTDGSTTTFTLGLTDWTLGQGAQNQPSFGNTIVKTSMPSLNTLIDQQSTPSYLFTALQALPAGKTLQSITLPTTTTGGQLHIFAIGLSGPAYNNTGTSDDSSTTTANIDAQGNSFSAQALNSADVFPGQQFVSSDLAFTLPSAVSGTPNNYQANGQILPITPVANATIVGFLGTATNGAASGTATATYTDGSTQTFTLGFADWTVSSTSSLPYHDSVAATMTYRNTKAGKQTLNNYVFTTEVAIDSTRTLQSITLPSIVTGGQLHIFAISTRSVLNNIGTSLDSTPGSSSFDGIHDSYSAQTLLNANFLPGQPVIYDGVSFLWPGTYGTIGDNYQAAGQVLSVNPVPQATTVAFIGSSTQGASSGTATLTYTDGSTQTFTLGFTDWCTTTLQFNNQVVARFPYRNAPSGEQTGTCGLYYASTSLQAGKTLQSVTLPAITTASQMHIFAIGTRSGAYNNASTSDDTQPTFANYDGNGGSYSMQALQMAGVTAGQTVTVNGTSFTWPNGMPGFFNNYQAAGQVVSVASKSNATTLAFLGSAISGPSSGTATITYTDGTTQTFTLGFADWNVSSISSLPSSNSVAFTMSYRNAPAVKQTLNTYVFYTSTPIKSGKTVKSVTLPTSVTQGQLHVFAIGLK